jgi:Riboflavin kinase
MVQTSRCLTSHCLPTFAGVILKHSTRWLPLLQAERSRWSPATQVEAHLLDGAWDDFYGDTLKLLVTGFIRPEMNFNGLPELIERIQKDIGTAKAQLLESELLQLESASFFCHELRMS